MLIKLPDKIGDLGLAENPCYTLEARTPFPPLIVGDVIDGHSRLVMSREICPAPALIGCKAKCRGSFLREKPPNREA
ncbi:MAG: hypothetical protein M2R45_01501 [Verrucomicrobia subdivision 3 bacterium]|nr:hypothetical protein [Limisphaerales bacterium]MCS1413369.1 hypothetical protein [Limisphaerales bacterium]